jgi:predicted metal-dependent peptidase
MLIDDRFRGMSAERIYNLISERRNQDRANGERESQNGSSFNREGGEQPNDPSAGGEPTAPTTPGGFGQVLDAPEPENGEGKTVVEQARDWQIAVEQAENVAKLARKLPAGAQRTLAAAQAARVDWRELLRRAWFDTTPSDYSWIRPNRRPIWAGVYLPGIASEGVGEVAIAVDCSGSINTRQLGQFEAEIRSIVDGQRPRLVHVLYFDATVHKVETYQPGEQIRLSPLGGGGTDFRPCFRWLEDQCIEPQTLVFLTDLWGTFPESAPIYPVLWASTASRCAPFGQVIRMDAA